MNATTRHFAASCLERSAALCLSLVCAFSFAQEDPFGAGAKRAGEEAPAPTATKKTATRPETVEREPLVIELLRASNPSTPEQLISAAQSAMQFGRPDESKKHLAKLLEDKPGDDAVAPLTARYGPFLLQLGSINDLQPEGKQVAEMVHAAAQRVAQSSERIAALISQLTAPNPGQRQEAAAKLSDAGVGVVNPVLRVLADPNRVSEHAQLRSVLVSMAETTELPLIAALDARDQNLVLQVIAMLGRMRSKRAVLRLIPLSLDPQSSPEVRQLATAALQKIMGAAPDLSEAERYLRRYADQYLRGDLDYDTNVDDSVTLWHWDEAEKGVVSQVFSRMDAGVELARGVAISLSWLNPADSSIRRLNLLTRLEQIRVTLGLDQPLLVDKITGGGGATLSDVNQVLLDAMRLGHVHAAVAAAEVLRHLGEPAALSRSVSPLAQALNFSDRRVRLAAALACVKLAPGEPFPGAGRLGDTLAWFIATTGTDSVLIAHPRGEEAQSLVGFVNALGYEGEGAYTGRMLAERAFVNSDFSFILISDAIDGPPVEELVQWLRRDYRTARQPIGVMARGTQLLRLQEAFADDPSTTVFPRIHSVEVCNTELNKLKAIAGRNLVVRDERLIQARAALEAFEVLAKRSKVLAQYDLLRQQPTIIAALNNPALTAQSAALLVYFPTPAAQTALVDFASQSNRPLTDRQAAATAFAASVRLRGLLLSQSQIAQQFARYNVSQTGDKTTQDLLGSILDAIEAPAVARGDLPKQP